MAATNWFSSLEGWGLEGDGWEGGAERHLQPKSEIKKKMLKSSAFKDFSIARIRPKFKKNRQISAHGATK